MPIESVPSSIVTDKKAGPSSLVLPSKVLSLPSVLLYLNGGSASVGLFRVTTTDDESISRSTKEQYPMAVTTPITRTNSLEFARKVPVFKSATHEYFVDDVVMVIKMSVACLR